MQFILAETKLIMEKSQGNKGCISLPLSLMNVYITVKGSLSERRPCQLPGRAVLSQGNHENFAWKQKRSE